MTEEKIKEQLSNRFNGILNANKGFVVAIPELDLGIDYQYKRPTTYTTLQCKTRYTYVIRYIDLQLKATSAKSIIDEPHILNFGLEVKSFNDLVERQIYRSASLLLILFILPNDQNLWVDIYHTDIRLRKHAYWFKPLVGSLLTNNGSSIRIEIPNANMLEIDCLDNF